MTVMRFDERGFVEERDDYGKQLFLKKIADYDKQIAPTMRANGYKRVDSSERTVLFTFGEITFSRSRWRRGDETRYPVDDWLGLKPYMRHSPELVLCMAKYASKLSYREVCRTIKATYDLVVTKDAVLKAVKEVGSLFDEKEHYRFLIEEDRRSQKIQADKIYLEGDGVMVKTTSSGDERHHTDLAHFIVHTGSKKIGHNRYMLQNKHEIIHANHSVAQDELLDYLYNHFVITDETILITNSDNGNGYTKQFFQDIKQALRIKRHEHFWDAYHLNKHLKEFLSPYPPVLRRLVFKAIQTHNSGLLQTVLDTIESLIQDDEECQFFVSFRRKIIRNFADTKPAKLRGLPRRGIGVMESQHRKVTYRMKHRGMYWSVTGACTMAKLIILERLDQLEDLFFGDWRDKGDGESPQPPLSAAKIRTKQNRIKRQYGLPQRNRSKKKK